MNKIMTVLGYLLSAAGWFAVIVYPARVAYGLWNAGYTPSAAELIPLATLIAIGAGFIFLGRFLRHKFV